MESEFDRRRRRRFAGPHSKPKRTRKWGDVTLSRTIVGWATSPTTHREFGVERGTDGRAHTTALNSDRRLKQVRIKKQTYKDRLLAGADVWGYIQMFYVRDVGQSPRWA